MQAVFLPSANAHFKLAPTAHPAPPFSSAKRRWLFETTLPITFPIGWLSSHQLGFLCLVLLAQANQTRYAIFMRTHLIGIGGVGMSALAQALLDLGHEVSGSDRLLDASTGDVPAVFATLHTAGAHLYPQNGVAITPDLDAIIISSAIEDENPDLATARHLRLPILSRAQMLARLVGGRRLIAVGGTAGKTTVTGMIGWTLEQIGWDPFVVNGGELVSWSRAHRIGSVRVGAGPWCVIETDESDRSLLLFEPTWAAITNISKDHFEPDEIRRLFREFVGRISEGVVADAETLLALRGALGSTTFVEAPPLTDVGFARGGVFFRYRGRLVRIRIPGRHNAENARLTLALLEALGADIEAAIAALAEFRGIRRRLEWVGNYQVNCPGHGPAFIPIFDDYAHNPAKIAASWRAMAIGARRVLGVWRPHGFGPLSLMFDELIEMFDQTLRPSDRLFLLPVYYAGGTARVSKTSEDLAEALRRHGKDVGLATDYDDLRRSLTNDLRPDDVILVMGARDPGLSTFCRKLTGN